MNSESSNNNSNESTEPKPKIKINIRKIVTTPDPNPTYHLTGTSGYQYEHWMSKFLQFQSFYPIGLTKPQMLGHYAKHLNFVELNTTFYGNPSPETVVKWYDESPADFRFLAKCNKYISHSKRLIDFEETYPPFLSLIGLLKEKCVGIIIQTPPVFANNPTNFQRVRAAGLFSKSHPNPYKYQVFIEFRHPSWFTNAVYEMLAEVGWSLTIVNLNNVHGGFGEMKTGFSPNISELTCKASGQSQGELTSGKAITVPGTIMFRCHGTWSARAYMGEYSDMDLMTMASIASNCVKGIVAFDNTDSYQEQIESTWVQVNGKYKLLFNGTAQYKDKLLPHAIQDALKIKALLS